MSTLARPAVRIGVLVGTAVGAAGFALAASIVRLSSRGHPDMARLMAAPVDHEPFTLEQKAAVKAAMELVDHRDVVYSRLHKKRR